MARIAAAALILLSASCAGTSDEAEDADVDAGQDVRVEEQRYEIPPKEAWTAAEAALEEEHAEVQRRRRRDSGGDLLALRADGRRIKVRLRALGADAVRVSVSVGSGDGATAARVQQRIGERLSLAKARAELFAESSLRTSYGADLSSCVAAAEAACRALGLELVDLLVQEDLARVVARDPSARPVRFELSRAEGREGVTDALFAVGATAEGGEEEVLQRLKREFESRLFPASE